MAPRPDHFGRVPVEAVSLTMRSLARRAYSRIPLLLLLAALILSVVSFSLQESASRQNSCYAQIPICDQYVISVASANQRTAALAAFVGAVLFLAASVLGRYRRVFVERRRPAPRPGRDAGAAILITASVAFIAASVALSLVPPPFNSVALTNDALHVTFQGPNGILDSVSVQASAGQVIEGWYTARWYANQSGQYAGTSEGALDIVPTGAPLDMWHANFTENYRVPQSGPYTLFFQDDSCSLNASTCDGNYSAVATVSLDLLGPENVSVLQTASLGSAAAAWVGAIVLGWSKRPAVRGPPWSDV